MFAVVVHRAAALAIERDTMAAGLKVNRLLVDVFAAAADFAIDPVVVPANVDDVTFPGISFATRKGRGIELAHDIFESEIHVWRRRKIGIDASLSPMDRQNSMSGARHCLQPLPQTLPYPPAPGLAQSDASLLAACDLALQRYRLRTASLPVTS
jgi:hypothetical protein